MKKLFQKLKDKYTAEAPEKGTFRMRLLFTILGYAVCAFSVGFFRMAVFGVDPFQALLSGIDHALPAVRFSTVSLCVYIIMLAFDLFMDRRLIGIGTILILTTSGSIIEFSDQLMHSLFPEVSFIGRIVFLIVGIVVMCIAGAFYMASDLGVSPYDAVALSISEKTTRVQFRVIRIIVDMVCVAAGILLYLLFGGGSFRTIGVVAGVGTVITAFFMGPLLQFFRDHWAMPLLKKSGSR